MSVKSVGRFLLGTSLVLSATSVPVARTRPQPLEPLVVIQAHRLDALQVQSTEQARQLTFMTEETRALNRALSGLDAGTVLPPAAHRAGGERHRPRRD